MFLRAVLGAGSLVAVPVGSMATISHVYAAEKEEKTAEVAAITNSDVAQKVAEDKPRPKDPIKSQLKDPIKSQLNQLRESKKDKTVLVSELPLYGEPAPLDLVYLPEKEEALRQYVTVARQAVWRQLDNFEGAWTLVKDKYRTGAQHTQDLLQYLREDAGALPRATFITVSGLGGVILGYRVIPCLFTEYGNLPPSSCLSFALMGYRQLDGGGVIRKTLYAAGGMTGAAAVCYPPQAIDLSKRGWVYTREQAAELWRQATAADSSTVESPAKEAPKPEKSEEQSTKDAVKVSDKPEKEPSAEPKKDFGMSKEEDKDMYSTRSS